MHWLDDFERIQREIQKQVIDNLDKMTPEEKVRSIQKIESDFKNKIESDSDKYDVAKVNRSIASINAPQLTEEQKQHIAHHKKEYFKKLQSDTTQSQHNPRLEKKQLMDFDEGKLHFHKMLLSSFHDTTFKYDQYNTLVIKKLFMYIIQDPRLESPEMEGGPWSLKKGIFIFGGIGTGKTNLMRVLSMFSRAFKLESHFKMNDFEESNEECQGKKGIAYLKNFERGDWCHDELIPKRVKSMGNELDPAKTIIRKNYDRYCKSGNPTHYTSNVKIHELNEIMGARIYSRLQHMCNFVYLGGPNRRPEENIMPEK